VLYRSDPTKSPAKELKGQKAIPHVFKKIRLKTVGEAEGGEEAQTGNTDSGRVRHAASWNIGDS